MQPRWREVEGQTPGDVGAVFSPAVAGEPGVACESAAGFQRSGLRVYLPGLDLCFGVGCYPRRSGRAVRSPKTFLFVVSLHPAARQEIQ